MPGPQRAARPADCYGAPVTSPVLLCTDGSDRSIAALAAGLALLRPGILLVVVTVMDDADPSLLTGTGFAGGVMSPVDFEQIGKAAEVAAHAVIAAATESLGIEGADSRILAGDAGTAICQLASDLSAQAIVMGSRGRGGLKRAVLGSVSDHVVRNAPCPVVVTGDRDEPRGG
jgi:nucleotide-binding universal stress UspA family protein